MNVHVTGMSQSKKVFFRRKTQQITTFWQQNARSCDFSLMQRWLKGIVHTWPKFVHRWRGADQNNRREEQNQAFITVLQYHMWRSTDHKALTDTIRVLEILVESSDKTHLWTMNSPALPSWRRIRQSGGEFIVTSPVKSKSACWTLTLEWEKSKSIQRFVSQGLFDATSAVYNSWDFCWAAMRLFAPRVHKCVLVHTASCVFCHDRCDRKSSCKKILHCFVHSSFRWQSSKRMFHFLWCCSSEFASALANPPRARRILCP